MVAHIYNPRTQEAESEVSQVQGQPELHSKFKVSMDHIEMVPPHKPPNLWIWFPALTQHKDHCSLLPWSSVFLCGKFPTVLYIHLDQGDLLDIRTHYHTELVLHIYATSLVSFLFTSGVSMLHWNHLLIHREMVCTTLSSLNVETILKYFSTQCSKKVP